MRYGAVPAGVASYHGSYTWFSLGIKHSPQCSSPHGLKLKLPFQCIWNVMSLSKLRGISKNCIIVPFDFAEICHIKFSEAQIGSIELGLVKLGSE